MLNEYYSVDDDKVRNESYGKSSTRNEEIMKSLAELKDEFKPTTKEVTPSLDPQVPSVQKVSAKDISLLLRMKAESAAELYLGTDDTNLFLKFLDFYVNLSMEIENSNYSDEKIVKVFNLFSGDLKKSAEFMEISAELEELGFEEEKVISALMLHSNDRELALDFLMKN